jgi:hypothetical protein
MTPSAVALLALLAAAGSDVAPPAYAPGEVPAELRPSVARAEAAFQSLQKKLQARLVQSMAAGGPSAAIAVCRDDAPRLAAETAGETGLRLGRTSDRLRNPRNAAPPWASPHVQASAGSTAAGVQPVVVDLGRSVGVLVPIAVGSTCTRCHGPPDALSPEVRRMLSASYPADRAVGYREGDHRGYFWAEVAR